MHGVHVSHSHLCTKPLPPLPCVFFLISLPTLTALYRCPDVEAMPYLPASREAGRDTHLPPPDGHFEAVFPETPAKIGCDEDTRFPTELPSRLFLADRQDVRFFSAPFCYRYVYPGHRAICVYEELLVKSVQCNA